MSGPPAAVAATRLALRDWIETARRRDLLSPGTPITVACSGGADSLAMCAAAVFEGLRSGHPIWGVTVDHGLQPGSNQRAEIVASVMRGLGCARVEIRATAVGTGGGPEGAARSARYAALREFAADGRWVLIGHTLDDQAETVLLGLGRGSGARSLAGMQQFNQPWGRPLLGLRRADTRAACDALELPVWNDPHNVDPRFARVRIRHEVLPLLEQILGGGVAESLARTAAQLRADGDVLDRLAAAALADHTQPIDQQAAEQQATEPKAAEPQATELQVTEPPAAQPRSALQVGSLPELPSATRTRVLKKWLEAADVGPTTSAHIQALDQLVVNWHGQGAAYLPHGFSVVRDHAILILNSPRPTTGTP